MTSQLRQSDNDHVNDTNNGDENDYDDVNVDKTATAMMRMRRKLMTILTYSVLK